MSLVSQVLPRLWNLLFFAAGADLAARALHVILPRTESNLGGFRSKLEGLESAGPFFDRLLFLCAALLLVLMLPALLVRDRGQRQIGGALAVLGLVFLGLEAASVLRPWPLPQTIASSLVGFVGLGLCLLALVSIRRRKDLLASALLLLAAALPALWRLLVRVEDAGTESAMRGLIRQSIELVVPVSLIVTGLTVGPPRSARAELIPLLIALPFGVVTMAATDSSSHILRELTALWIGNPLAWVVSLTTTAAVWGLARCLIFDVDRRRAVAAALLALVGFRSQTPAAVTTVFVALILLELSRRRGPERLIPV
ncbi:MAG: hypothetical protein KDB53_03020 [Planctomycetes bacterium]|nr:hypothetical protein [Planctomycetota bacterium]